MSVGIGAQLGPYQVLQPLGAGGMGEVYKARDTRLNRTVAIKVLTPEFASRSDWKQRFEREARTIASLSHPHICTLHDVGQQDGIDYLVMEYLEGQTLAQRLERGALPLDEALKSAVEIADALDKAHRQGIVHRDLKPANIMLTKAGVKLLDFGLAKPKTVDPGNSQRSDVPTAKASLGVTAEGTILGTLQYISPEQLEGLEADARSDIFAFGAVLYEMITGRKAFEGRTQSSVIGAILHTDPPNISALQPMTPGGLGRLVKTCLAKDPDKRWQTAHDLGRELQWLSEDGAQAGAPVSGVAQEPNLDRLPWIIAALATVLAVASAFLALQFYQRPTELPMSRFEIQTPEFRNPYQVSISPDGKTIAFVADREDGKTALFLRPIDSVVAQPLAGTEGALLPFWSPDSQNIGYSDPLERKLKKITVRGGLPQTLCDAPYSGNFVATGTWNSEGVIVFANGDSNQPLYKVPAAGGPPVRITSVDHASGENGHAWPWFLPDGRHFLYMVWSSKPESRAIYIGSVDSDKRTRLMSAESMAVYAPPGFLLFEREKGLFAQRFDDKRQTLSGDPVPIAEDVIYNPSNGRASFAVASNGTLIYRSGHNEFPLTWVDRSGKTEGVIAEPAGYLDPMLSPDEKRLVVEKERGSDGDLWIMDLVHGTSTQFTSNPSRNTYPLWSPDGKRVAFASDRGGRYNLYVKDSEGTSNEQLLWKSDHAKFPAGWSADGRFLTYTDFTPSQDSDIWVLPMGGDQKPFVFLQTQFREGGARVSPDSHWIAYHSNESGRDEVYVQSFPAPGGKVQISAGGGTLPKWRADGKEIFYTNGNFLMAAEVIHAQPGKPFEVTAPRLLFQATLRAGLGRPPSGGISGSNDYPYDVTRDGQRFIITGFAQAAQLPAIPITVVLNWPSLFQKK